MTGIFDRYFGKQISIFVSDTILKSAYQIKMTKEECAFFHPCFKMLKYWNHMLWLLGSVPIVFEP